MIRQTATLTLITTLVLAGTIGAETKPKTAAVLWHSLPPAQVLLPTGFGRHGAVRKDFQGDDFRAVVSAAAFAQGKAAYLEILPKDPKAKAMDPALKFSVAYRGRKVLVDRFRWGWRGLFALGPEETPGKASLIITTTNGTQEKKKDFRLDVGKTNWEVFKSTLNLGNYSDQSKQEKPEVIAFIKKCQKKKAEVFSRILGDTLTNRLAHPRETHNMTSPFYCKRIVERFKTQNGKSVALAPWVNIHNGLDLGGYGGEPIFAMADGRVVIAEKMHYEGNFVSIDHGNGIFTGYLHQSALSVKEGQLIKAGEVLGKVGSTGMATGPHLHIALYIRGIPVDPMSLLSLPIRN